MCRLVACVQSNTEAVKISQDPRRLMVVPVGIVGKQHVLYVVDVGRRWGASARVHSISPRPLGGGRARAFPCEVRAKHQSRISSHRVGFCWGVLWRSFGCRRTLPEGQCLILVTAGLCPADWLAVGNVVRVSACATCTCRLGAVHLADRPGRWAVG